MANGRRKENLLSSANAQEYNIMSDRIRPSDLPYAGSRPSGVGFCKDNSGNLMWDGGGSIIAIGGSGVDPVASIDAGNATFSLLHDNGISRFNTVDVKATGKFVYVDPINGLDSRTRAQAMVSATPWQTPRQVYDAATSGDGAYIAAGTYVANGVGDYPDAFHRLGGNSKSLSYIATGDVVFKSTNISNAQGFVSNVPNNGFSYTSGITFDGENTIQTGLGNGDMSTNVWTLTYEDCVVKDFINYGCLISNLRVGTFKFLGTTFSGGFSAGALTGSSGTIASNGNVTIDVVGCNFLLSRTGTMIAITQDVSATITNTLDFNITDNTFNVTSVGTSGYAAAVFVKTSGTEILRNTITVATDAANTNASYGVLQFATAFEAIPDAMIASNNVTFLCPAGYSIALGNSAGVSITGTIEKNTVTGQYYATATPHGIAVDFNGVGTVRYNKVSDLYAQILASKTAAGTVISENVTMNGYGADLYAKGCTAATFNKNTCIVTDKYTRRNLGAISVDSQGGVNTTATTMSNNVVLVTTDDLSKIGALVNITNNQTCTYSNNVYVVPDTIPDSTVLFYVGGSEGGRAGATGYTIDQWRAATSITNGTGTVTVTNDRVIKLPIAEIMQMVTDLGVTLGPKNANAF